MFGKGITTLRENAIRRECRYFMNNVDINSIKLYHIVHVDRLHSILNFDNLGQLICDSDVKEYNLPGTAIGMRKIKERRMNELVLNSYPGLYVGDCVPFYFCPRSIMLYILHQKNHPGIEYKGGQEPIVHLVFKMAEVISWANRNCRRWVFTDSNAGSRYFNDYCNLLDINRLNWNAINTNNWDTCKEGKQAEFLVEKSLPWCLMRQIGVYSLEYYHKVREVIATATHKPSIEIKYKWYY